MAREEACCVSGGAGEELFGLMEDGGDSLAGKGQEEERWKRRSWFVMSRIQKQSVGWPALEMNRLQFFLMR